MSEWDSLQEDSGLVGCEALLYQEIAQLNEALAGTEDEISSFYRFGDEYSVLTDEDSEEDPLDQYSDHDDHSPPGNSVADDLFKEDKLSSDSLAQVKAVKRCIHHNQRFQERVKTRLSIISAHLKDIYTKLDKLEELKINAESGARVKVGFCLSGFCGCPYFSDESNRGPPANSDMKRNLQSSATLIYRNLKNYKFSTDIEKVEKDKKVLRQIVLKQCLEVLLDPLMEELHRNKDSGHRSELKEKMKQLERLSDEELSQRVSTDMIDWDKVAMTAFGGENHGAYCRQLWLNAVNPLLNMSVWSKQEDKQLLTAAKRRKYRGWREIGQELKTNRTPIQCLSRYQIHLNPQVSNNLWEPEEDHKLAEAVKKFGEGNWSLICSELGGRTADQCIQRWTRCVSTQHSHARRGKWLPEEDQELRNAVSIFGQQWVKVAKMVQTRNDRQCRERWCNILDPDLNKSSWSHNEDQKLLELCSKHQTKGAIKWSMVAKEMIGRTDAHCRQRYLTMQSHPQAIEYVKQHKKTLLFERRNKKVKHLGVFAGNKSELLGEDVEDDILSRKEQEQLDRFASRFQGSSAIPQCFTDPIVTGGDTGYTLPPCSVYGGTYHSSLLTAVQFSSVNSHDVFLDDTPTQNVYTPTCSVDTSRWDKGAPRDTPKNTLMDTLIDTPADTIMDTPIDTPIDAVSQSSMCQNLRSTLRHISSSVKIRTVILYQEFARPPHPRPYSPIKSWFTPHFSPKSGLAHTPTTPPPVQFPTPHLVDLHLHSQPPTLTQFFAFTSTPVDGQSMRGQNSSNGNLSLFMSPHNQNKLHSLVGILDNTSSYFYPVPYNNFEPPLAHPFYTAMSPMVADVTPHCTIQSPSHPLSETRNTCDTDRKLVELVEEARNKNMDPDAILSAVGPLYGLSYSGAGQTHSGAGQMHSGAGQTHSGAGQTHSGAGQAHSGAGQTHSGAGQTHSGAGQTHSGAGQTHSGAGQTHSGAGQTHSGAGQTFSGAGQTYSGAEHEGEQREMLPAQIIQSIGALRHLSSTTHRDTPIMASRDKPMSKRLHTVNSTAIDTSVMLFSTPAPLTSIPALLTSAPAPLTSTPAPLTSTPALLASTPAPLTSTPAPLTSTPAPLTSTPALLTSTPAPLTSTPDQHMTPVPLTASRRKRGCSSVSPQSTSLLSTTNLQKAFVSCGLPSQQFSTLMQAWCMSSPLTEGGQLNQSPRSVPSLPPSLPTLRAYQQMVTLTTQDNTSPPYTLHTECDGSEEYRKLVERFNSLFAWPAILDNPAQSKGKRRRR